MDDVERKKVFVMLQELDAVMERALDDGLSPIAVLACLTGQMHSLFERSIGPERTVEFMRGQADAIEQRSAEGGAPDGEIGPAAARVVSGPWL